MKVPPFSENSSKTVVEVDQIASFPLHPESHCTAFSGFHLPKLIQNLDFRYSNLSVNNHFLNQLRVIHNC